jgi:hypothetical protein
MDVVVAVLGLGEAGSELATESAGAAQKAAS